MEQKLLANQKKMEDIIKNLYTSKTADWIWELEENEIQPMIIQLWLVGNDFLRAQVKWLDKYVFSLPPRMYLSLAWSVIPKTLNVPYRTDKILIDETKDKYLCNPDEYCFILDKIRKQFRLSDNDFITLKPFLLKEIEKNKIEWFTYYGVEKKHWKDHYLNFELMKKEQKKQNTGLNAWFS